MERRGFLPINPAVIRVTGEVVGSTSKAFGIVLEVA
jgi:hypothetical protein